jgi:iron complex outermembrane recepter protein
MNRIRKSPVVANQSKRSSGYKDVSGATISATRKTSALLLTTTVLYGASLVLSVPVQAQDNPSATTALSPIVIEGESAVGPDNSIVAKRSRGASKTDTSLLETPQAVSVVTRAQIEQQGANNVAQALRYTPGVMSEPNGFDIRYDWLEIRGYDTHGTVWLDGLALAGDNSSYATPSINPYALERIEVLKGPASVLYGRAIPGGLVNYVSKRPQTRAHNEVEISTSSFGGVQASADFTGPLTQDGDWAYRLIGQGRNMGTQIDSERDRKIMLAPSLAWSPDKDTSLTLYGYYQKDDPKNFSARFFPAVGTLLTNPLGQIDRDTYFGNSGANEFNRNFYALGYEFSHDFNETWSVRQNVRYSRSSQDMFLVLTNPAFIYQSDGHTLNRVSAASDDEISSFNVDNQVEARFDTGSLQHTALFGFDYLRSTSDRNFGNSALGVPSFDYLNPDYTQAVIPYPAYTASSVQKQQQLGVYLQDQVRYDNWVGTFGLRYDHSQIETKNRIAGTLVDNQDSQATWRAGLTYLFDSGFAPYASYSTSFLPSLGTNAQTGDPYEAQEAEQFEVGVKYEPPGGRGMVTLSLFNLDLKNALTPYYVSGASVGYVQTGQQRVRGLEIEGKYELTSEIDVIGSYAFSDSEITESNNATELGREKLRLPRHQASLWVNYSPSFVPGLSVGAGVRGSSSYQTDSTYLEQLRIPGQALVDVGASYDFGALKDELKGTKLRVNVSNLFDREYVSHCLNITGGSCNYGAGRTVTASLKYSW